MVRAINRWDISSSRNINYRSFAPIIRWLDLNLNAIMTLFMTMTMIMTLYMTMNLLQAGGGSPYSRVSALGSVGACKSNHRESLSHIHIMVKRVLLTPQT